MARGPGGRGKFAQFRTRSPARVRRAAACPGVGFLEPQHILEGAMTHPAASEHPAYNYKVVRQFAIMTVVWGIVGMLVGVLIAAQLAFPALNFDLPWLSFGRLRPLHTNAVIFAFGGSALFASALFVVQRTCRARLFAPGLASFVFWGWQTVIVLAAVTLPL